MCALVRGMSRREAYMSAYQTQRMEDEIIDEKASRLFADDKVRARYEHLQAKAEKGAERRAVASPDDILKELSSIGLGTEQDTLSDAPGAEDKPSVTARLKALELLGKHHKLFVDQGGTAGTLPVRIVDDIDDKAL